MKFIRVDLQNDPDPWYVNMDKVTDFYYNSGTKKTYVTIAGEENERVFDGNITTQLLNPSRVTFLWS